ncbi:MAG: hypothetical protein SNJ55_13015 [Chloroherpetonaceae bacterium]
MSKKYIAVVKDGAIRIETPELEEGETVEVEISALPTDQTKTLFERLEQITVAGLPDDFSVSHKPKETHQ